MNETTSRAMVLHDSRPPLEKAAIIMIALDEERAQRILAKLDGEELRRISRAIAGLGRTDMVHVERTIGEFRSELNRSANLSGSVEAAERMLSRVMVPEKVAEIMDEIKGAPGGTRVWDKLAGLPPQALADYLGREYPQTAAVIVTRLPPLQAARVLALLPAEAGVEVALRMARMDSVKGSVLSGIETTLERDFGAAVTQAAETDSASVLAEMLNLADKDMVDRVLAALEEREPDMVGRVRKLMFTFADLDRVDPSTFGILIAECSADRLAVALWGAPQELRELFLSNMSERAGNMLREEIETMPQQRKKTVEEAQYEIVQLAKKLAEDGRIFLLEEGDEAAKE